MTVVDACVVVGNEMLSLTLTQYLCTQGGKSTQGIGVNRAVVPRFGGLNSFLRKKIALHSKPPYTSTAFVQSIVNPYTSGQWTELQPILGLSDL